MSGERASVLDGQEVPRDLVAVKLPSRRVREGRFGWWAQLSSNQRLSLVRIL
jgi:hypothetical protein